jgi:hypothetical protein
MKTQPFDRSDNSAIEPSRGNKDFVQRREDELVAKARGDSVFASEQQFFRCCGAAS